MTTNAAPTAEKPDHHAGAIHHAIALRMLHRYQHAREMAAWYGHDVSKLYAPPDFADLSDAYRELIQEWAYEHPDTVSAISAFVSLLAVMATDDLLGTVLNEGNIVSDEQDRSDAIVMLADIKRWINKVEIREFVQKDRAHPGLEREGR